MNIPLTPLRFLRYAEQQFPGRTAVVFNQERFTYTELRARVGRLAGVGWGRRPSRRSGKAMLTQRDVG